MNLDAEFGKETVTVSSSIFLQYVCISGLAGSISLSCSLNRWPESDPHRLGLLLLT